MGWHLAERAGFEPARQVLAAYSISNRAPSAKLSHLSSVFVYSQLDHKWATIMTTLVLYLIR